MLTFHGKQELKDSRIAQVRAHRIADQLVKGIYWQYGKGCAVGCTIHSSDHWAYESELGIPVELAYLEDHIFERLPNLEDHIFERLPNGEAMMWPERFLEAIPVGVDLRATHVNKRLILALLTDDKRGLVARVKSDKSKTEIREVAAFLTDGIQQPQPSEAPKELRDLTYLTYLAYRADLAYLAYLADLAEIFLEVLAASAAPHFSVPKVPKVGAR